MKFIPVNLKKNPNEIHSYIESSKKLRIANQFHWLALKYAASLVEPAGGGSTGDRMWRGISNAYFEQVF